MPFQKGNKYGGQSPGRPKGSKGAQVKSKYLAKWEQVFEDTNPIEKLTALAEKDYSEFLRLGLAAMPRDQKLEVEDHQTMTDEEYRKQVRQLNKMLDEDLKKGN